MQLWELQVDRHRTLCISSIHGINLYLASQAKFDLRLKNKTIQTLVSLSCVLLHVVKWQQIRSIFYRILPRLTICLILLLSMHQVITTS